MAFWNKKKSTLESDATPVAKCNHKYKDFPWYVQAVYYTYDKEHSFKVFEPYVCIYCGYRIDKLLFERKITCSAKEADHFYEAFMKEYGDKVQDRVVIEDQINDMILVDREHLKFYELIRNGKIEAPKLNM